MALSDKELAALMANQEFTGRVKVCALRYGDNITIQEVAASSHTGLLRYASETFLNPDIMTQKLVPLVVMDSAVQESGANITDAALQASVEVTVNKLYS